ncbi:MAG TPA: protein kinase [Pyrinomonadaceae bacterium]|nr:protein kinase [Pyrinomonadaceae bacterium]
MALEPGTQLGRYKIISPLGHGGMGEVYLASDTRLERTVAIKVLPEEVSHNQQRLQRFDREARAASTLNHPNVAHIYEIETCGEHTFIAMEYINGETLRKRLSHTRMKLHDALDIAVQVTRAIAAAHAAGIVHRDIKTENIMISRDGYVKVLDFGLAKLMSNPPENPDPAAATVTSAHTDPGVVMGTVSYMSPEQARGLPTDARTDLWSLGVVLYEMVSGTTPFVGKTPPDVLSAILNEEPPPLARFSRDIPEALEWIVSKALTKDLEGRHQTATSFLTDLQRLKNRLGAEAEIERSSLPEFRLSRNSFAGDSRVAFETSRASAVNTGLTNSAPQQSSAEYIVSGIKRHKKGTLITLALLLFSIAAGALMIALLRNKKDQVNAPPPQRPLTHVTIGSGLQLGATWSADASLIAYSSDQGGNFDIWVRSVDGGNPFQVTHSPAHDWQPDWSPVSNNIVFRSERDGGGLFIVPSLGGNERKITSFGYRPRWSPDGSKILFLGPGQRLYDFPKMYLIAPGDDAPREIPTSFSKTEEGIKGNSVAWHPDGQRVSFLSTDRTFWTVPIAGGAPVKSERTAEVESALKEAAVELGNFRWSQSGKFIYFEGTSRGVLNLWRVTVEPESLRWIDGPERLTTGQGQDADITLSPDGKKIAFTTLKQDTRIWLLPFDSNAGHIKGDGLAITDAGMDAWYSDLSPDGKKLAFASQGYGIDKEVLKEKSLADGVERVLAGNDDSYRYFPRWSPDSTRLAYSRFRAITPQGDGEANPPQGANKTGPIVMLDLRSGEEQLLTSQGQWLDYMYDWSPDGQLVLASSNRQTREERWEVCLFPIAAAPHAETEMRVVASDPQNSLWTPRFSPDGRWICYAAQKPHGASVSVLYVVPSSGGTPVRITGENTWCDWPRWSPDGKTIYFVSNYNSSFLNVWGIHFDPAQGHAAGDPFRVTTFESPGRMISPQLAQREMSLNKNQLALPITEVSGNIWVLGNVDR